MNSVKRNIIENIVNTGCLKFLWVYKWKTSAYSTDRFTFYSLGTRSIITIASRYESFIECSGYTFLNESNRAVTYYNRRISHLCDSNLTGWYRFSGEAGTQMAESCANKHYCGTDAPGWLSGGHPALTDGPVKRKVCFSSFGQCCYYSNYVTVKNCGGFYVYKLERPPQCNLRYCGNGLPYAQGT